MKKHQSAFSYFGFVCLADTLFAVSAGLLLLNPIKLNLQQDDAAPKNQIQERANQVVLKVKETEEQLKQMEAKSRQIYQQAKEVVRNE